jgi:hypothetical protein
MKSEAYFFATLAFTAALEQGMPQHDVVPSKTPTQSATLVQL